MIRRLKYSEIDFVRYQKVLSEACQVDDFASREFMDIVAGKNWGILVYKDYEAVMPIAWSSNLGIKIIQMPPLCHQLGVFSEEDNPQINQDFSNFLKKNFAISYYAFNKDNAFPTGSRNKKSYVILKDRYEDVKKKYHVHRRRNIRHTEDIKANAEFISNINPDEIENFFLENARGLPSRSLKKVYWKIVSRLIETGFLEAFAVKYKGNLHSFVATFNAGETDYLSIFINASQLENKNIPSLAIDCKLQNAIEHKNFDFMGSNVPNVASFNERFGAQPYLFSILNYQKLNVISKIIKLAFTKNR